MRELVRAIVPYDVRPKKRFSDAVRGLERTDFLDAFGRCLAREDTRRLCGKNISARRSCER